MKKIAIYIDGQNTYHALKAMGIRNTSRYGYGAFLTYLTGGLPPSFIGYYVAQLSRERSGPRSEILYEGQQRFLSHLYTDVKRIRVIKGKIMRVERPSSKCTEKECPMRQQPVYYEKGVDVRMAIDIVHHAVKNEYDEAFILSSDSDLLPAVQRAQEAGKVIHYIGFQNHKSIALMAECDLTRLLTKEECGRYAAGAVIKS